jgi:hypothetical protein
MVGAELSADWRLSDGWRLHGGATLQRPRLTRDMNGNALLRNLRLPVVPDISARLGLARDIDVRGWRVTPDLSANPSVRYAEVGALYGGQLGYDWQSNNIVYGIEGEVIGATAKHCDTIHYRTGATDRSCVRHDRDFYVGGRIGAVLEETTLLYAKAGYTNAHDIFDYRVDQLFGQRYGRRLPRGRGHRKAARSQPDA